MTKKIAVTRDMTADYELTAAIDALRVIRDHGTTDAHVLKVIAGQVLIEIARAQ